MVDDSDRNPRQVRQPLSEKREIVSVGFDLTPLAAKGKGTRHLAPQCSRKPPWPTTPKRTREGRTGAPVLPHCRCFTMRRRPVVPFADSSPHAANAATIVEPASSSPMTMTPELGESCGSGMPRQGASLLFGPAAPPPRSRRDDDSSRYEDGIDGIDGIDDDAATSSSSRVVATTTIGGGGNATTTASTARDPPPSASSRQLADCYARLRHERILLRIHDARYDDDDDPVPANDAAVVGDNPRRGGGARRTTQARSWNAASRSWSPFSGCSY